MPPSDVAGSLDIDAPPERVYALITDLAIMAELAEETESMRWTTGSAAVPGAVFKGGNRKGWRRWTTTCTVTAAEAGRRFAFDVTHTRVPVATWHYDIEPTATGCRVTESTTDRRPKAFATVSGIALGVKDRGARNATHIHRTLARLKQRAEAG